MSNSHPHIKCPSCYTRTRWNPRNLKLFKHKDALFEYEDCRYGGQTILYWYYEQLLNAKDLAEELYNQSYLNPYYSICDTYFLKYRLTLESKIKWFLENDKF